MVVDELFSLAVGRGVGQGGADVSQLQACGSVACGGRGGTWEEFLSRAGAGAGHDGCCSGLQI